MHRECESCNTLTYSGQACMVRLHRGGLCILRMPQELADVPVKVQEVAFRQRWAS